MKWFIAAFSCFAFYAHGLADEGQNGLYGHDQRLNGDAILQDFLGTTFNGAYSLTKDGEPTRFYTETHQENSEVLYVENGESFPGIWTIRRNLMCYDYYSDAMNGGCFKIFRSGNCYYFYGDIVPSHLIGEEKNYWTARSVIKGQTPDCDPGIS